MNVRMYVRTVPLRNKFAHNRLCGIMYDFNTDTCTGVLITQWV